MFSRPTLSDTQPNNGRVSPFVKRSIVNASGNAAIPNTSTLVTPKSAAKVAICEVTMRPDVDIMVIIANISQKSGVFKVCDGRKFVTAGVEAEPGRAAASCAGGTRKPCEASRPTTANPMPNIQSVASMPRACSDVAIGNVVTIAPMP